MRKEPASLEERALTSDNKSRLYQIVKDWHDDGWQSFRNGYQKKRFGDMCRELGIVAAKYGEYVPGFVGIPYPNSTSSLNHALFLPPDLALKILTLGYIPNP